MSVPYAKVIVNPVAGGCSVRRQWPRISEHLHNIGLPFDYEFTEGAGHATELARRAAEIGYSCLIVVGGDGTVNEVANGLLCSTRSARVILGIISTGSACSFARSLGVPQDYYDACSLLMGKGRLVIDVGVVKCQTNGQPIQRYFVNTADVGLGSAIVDAWEFLPNNIGRSLNRGLRTVQGLRCLFQHRYKFVTLHEGGRADTIFSRDIIIANGQYFADGMRIAPRAKLNDGLLDVVSVGELGTYQLLKIWPKLYGGGHIGNSKVKEVQTTGIAIESECPLTVEADGIKLGETPASFWVIPSALTIVV